MGPEESLWGEIVGITFGTRDMIQRDIQRIKVVVSIDDGAERLLALRAMTSLQYMS